VTIGDQKNTGSCVGGPRRIRSSAGIRQGESTVQDPEAFSQVHMDGGQGDGPVCFPAHNLHSSRTGRASKPPWI